jgi:hypothetical protein
MEGSQRSRPKSGALERAMVDIGAEAENIDENDPRQAAQLMRRLFQATGMPGGGAVQEM